MRSECVYSLREGVGRESDLGGSRTLASAIVGYRISMCVLFRMLYGRLEIYRMWALIGPGAKLILSPLVSHFGRGPVYV